MSKDNQDEEGTCLYIPIAGTWSRRRNDRRRAFSPWYRRDSAFDHVMESCFKIKRFEQDRDPEKPDKGYWSGDLEGSLLTGDFTLLTSKFDEWKEGARNLADTITKRKNDAEQFLIVAHSHGGQVALICLNKYLEKELRKKFYLITVDTPNRRDMEKMDYYEEWWDADDHHQKWVHLHSKACVRALGARSLGRHEMRNAKNFSIPDHGSVLRRAHTHMKTWKKVKVALNERGFASGHNIPQRNQSPDTKISVESEGTSGQRRTP